MADPRRRVSAGTPTRPTMMASGADWCDHYDDVTGLRCQLAQHPPFPDVPVRFGGLPHFVVAPSLEAP